MKNVWKGMLMGAIVGTGLDVATSIASRGGDIAESTAQRIRRANLPRKAGKVLDDASSSDATTKAVDAVVHAASIASKKVSDIASHN